SQSNARMEGTKKAAGERIEERVANSGEKSQLLCVHSARMGRSEGDESGGRKRTRMKATERQREKARVDPGSAVIADPALLRDPPAPAALHRERALERKLGSLSPPPAPTRLEPESRRSPLSPITRRVASRRVAPESARRYSSSGGHYF
ncbi:hypothetical protein ALC60_10265, partial [Trachymyrmex zeteki]